MINNNDFLEDFINVIDHDLALRKKHLTLLYEILETLEYNNHKFAFIRTTIPELYAQYEGFLKYGFMEMFKTLKIIQPANIDVNINLLIFPLITKMENHLVTQDAKGKRLHEVFKKAFVDNKSFFEIVEIDKVLINQSTLETTFNILQIPLHDFPIDNLRLLYERRNAIAHGQLQTSNQFAIAKNRDITDLQVNEAFKIWLEDYKRILTVLDQLKDFFINYLKDGTYLAKVI